MLLPIEGKGRAERKAAKNLRDTRAPLRTCNGKTGIAIGLRALRHVGSLLFAASMCRKFATVAAFSWHLLLVFALWHLPHHKNAAAVDRFGSAFTREG
jgi:hypothetical protein